MQAKEKYQQHNASNSKENLLSLNNSDGPDLKRKYVNNHTTIASPSLQRSLSTCFQLAARSLLRKYSYK
jgi:hypothetical protein